MASDSESEDDLSSAMSDQDEEEESDNGLPAEIKDVPFGELEEVRMTMGTKKFDAAMHKRHSEESEVKTFSRKNKKRPIEQSSKKRVVRARPNDGIKKRAYRDPRFDSLSGEFHQDLFKKSYSFLESYRGREKKELQKEMKKTKIPHRKAEVAETLSRMQQEDERIRAQEKKEQAKREVRKALLKQGKKPFYIKKGDQRKLEIASKFAELKKKGQLEKFMAKKRRRNAARDRKRLPMARED